MLTIPVLRARRRHHGGRRHGAAARRLRRRAGRLHPRARRAVGRQRARDHVPERHLRLFGRRHLGDRLGDDPADGEGRLSARVRDQRDHHRLGAGAAGAAEPQRRHLFARDRRHHLDHQPVHGGRRAGPAARLLHHGALRRDRLSRRPSPRAERAVARGGEDHLRRAVGPGHARHHPRRHSRRRLHRDRSRRGRLRMGVLRHHVHLSRLSLARPAGAGPPHGAAPSPW